MKAIALGVRFVLELCILASLAALAAHLPVATWARILLGVLFCLSAAAVWGTFLAPKRRYEIGLVGRLLLEAGFFLGAALCLAYVGRPTWAIALLLVAVADRIALAFLA